MMHLECIRDLKRNRAKQEYIKVVGLHFVRVKIPVIFKSVLSNRANIASSAMFENKTRNLLRALFNLLDCLKGFERDPMECHSFLQVCAWTAVAPVARFEEEKSSHEG